jgi:hypothetical protein
VKRTPREELRRRRRSYLARVAIFDGLECPVPVDSRVAGVRRFRAGGDEFPLPTPLNEPPGPPPVNRAPKLEGAESVVARARQDEAETGQADYDAFGLGGGEINLFRITAQVIRAAERWRPGATNPLPRDVLELWVSELPGLDDRNQPLPKAHSLFHLCGITLAIPNAKGDGLDHFGFMELFLWQVLDVTDWSADRWDPQKTDKGTPAYVRLVDAVKGALVGPEGYLDTFFRDKPAGGPPCPASEPPQQERNDQAKQDDDPPPLQTPEPHLPNALSEAADALLAGFGVDSADALLTDLRGLAFPDRLIARLLYWIASSWERVPVDARRFVATKAWIEAHAELAQRSDVHAAEQAAWTGVCRLTYLLRFLGRLDKLPVRTVCIQLLGAWRSRFFEQTWATVARDGEGAVWARLEGELRGQAEALEGIAGPNDDAPFRLAAFQRDPETFGRELRGLMTTAPPAWTAAPSLRPARPQISADRLTSPDYDAVSAFYWRHVVLSKTLEHILGLKETGDFHVAEHIRFLGYFRPGGRLRPLPGDSGYHDDYEEWLREVVPDWFVDFASAALLRFKYWVDDPKTPRRDNKEMNFWSENHQVLFASGEYIVGQWFPDATFARSNQPGAWHRDRAKARLERWLEQHLKFGFAEVNSSVYYNWHLVAVLNVLDWAANSSGAVIRDDQVTDEDLAEDGVRLGRLALMVADLLVFDVVRRVCQGSFVSVSSRQYVEGKGAGWSSSIRDFVELLTGTLGDFSGTGEPAGLSLATSRYLDEAPEALIVIARDVANPMIDRSRVSISRTDAQRYGIGFESAEDIMFWWSHGAYFTDDTYRASQSWSARWNLRDGGPFKLFDIVDHAALRLVASLVTGAETFAMWAGLTAIYPPLGLLMSPRIVRAIADVVTSVLDTMIGLGVWVLKGIGALDENDDRVRVAKPILEQEIERLAIEMNAGSVIERMHLYSWRSADAMLSSIVDEKWGETSAQKEVCVATLGPDVSVFVTKPIEELMGIGEALGEAAGSYPEGLAGNLAVWETFPAAFDQGTGRAAPELIGAAEPIIISTAGEDILSDGPKAWSGYVSNPRVWQHENVAIAIYKPNGRQRDMSDKTHAYWPWDHFDEVRTNEDKGGRWLFGRRDRRFPPATPTPPRPEWRPSEERPWPTERPSRLWYPGGAGYVALFSARSLRTKPAGPRGWAHKEVIADGDDNIWITVVGDEATYKSFDLFQLAVLGCIKSVSVDEGYCSVVLPQGRRKTSDPARVLELSWEAGAKLGGAVQSTDEWPRFELGPSTLGYGLAFGVNSLADPRKGRVDWDETGWRIVASGGERDEEGRLPNASVEHDFADLTKPRRRVVPFPPISSTDPGAMADELDEGFADMVAARSELGAAFRPSRRAPVGPRRRDPYARRLR